MTEPSIRAVSPSLPAGRMTAMMRAVSATAAPRLLRVGVVRAGRVVEERVLKRPETITIGRDEAATFVVPDADAPARMVVLERDKGAYHLCVRAPLGGRLALVDGLHDVAALRGRGRITLDDGARGRIVLGATTLLFQFVPAPPESPRPRLPLSVREGVRIDAALTIIAAFSFLLHFGLVGALYSDWTDPIVDEGISVGTLARLEAGSRRRRRPTSPP